jgi:hypothetical protein
MEFGSRRSAWLCAILLDRRLRRADLSNHICIRLSEKAARIKRIARVRTRRISNRARSASTTIPAVSQPQIRNTEGISVDDILQRLNGGKPRPSTAKCIFLHIGSRMYAHYIHVMRAWEIGTIPAVKGIGEWHSEGLKLLTTFFK